MEAVPSTWRYFRPFCINLSFTFY